MQTANLSSELIAQLRQISTMQPNHKIQRFRYLVQHVVWVQIARGKAVWHTLTQYSHRKNIGFQLQFDLMRTFIRYYLHSIALV